jgi:hypothetical protein
MNGFEEIIWAASQMEGFAGPWFVSGGWAIDLFLGRVTRSHGDREIGIARADQFALQERFAHLALFTVADGKWRPWNPGEWLSLPMHQVLARPAGSPPPAHEHDFRPDEFEFFLNEIENGTWRCRRNMTITRPAGEIWIRSSLGPPVLVPEIQLLYKAKHTRPKDEQDFHAATPLLSSQQRSWLRRTLGITHPNHPWLAQL